MKFKSIKKLTCGFTLLEMLVVISIIGILASLITVSFLSSQKQARDTQRKSDLSQYRTSLENFSNAHSGFYPVSISVTNPSSSSFCSSLGISGTCPDDPKAPDYNYKYISNGTAGQTNATLYVMWARLENFSPLKYWIVCSTGKAGTVTTQPSTSTCPI